MAQFGVTILDNPTMPITEHVSVSKKQNWTAVIYFVATTCMVYHHHLVYHHRNLVAETASQRLGDERHDERKEESR